MDASTISSSTLIYKLNDEAPITFNQFYLIVRALHTYKVETFTPDEENKIVTVKLAYNASMKNVRAKLGSVPATVTKANPFIQNSELSELESLRSTFQFGATAEEEESDTPRPNKKRCYKKVC